MRVGIRNIRRWLVKQSKRATRSRLHPAEKQAKPQLLLQRGRQPNRFLLHHLQFCSEQQAFDSVSLPTNSYVVSRVRALSELLAVATATISEERKTVFILGWVLIADHPMMPFPLPSIGTKGGHAALAVGYGAASLSPICLIFMGSVFVSQVLTERPVQPYFHQEMSRMRACLVRENRPNRPVSVQKQADSMSKVYPLKQR